MQNDGFWVNIPEQAPTYEIVDCMRQSIDELREERDRLVEENAELRERIEQIEERLDATAAVEGDD